MKSRNCLLAALIVGGLLVVLLIIGGGLSAYLLNRHVSEKRASSAAPVIFVHAPDEGDTVQLGEPLQARVTASGVNPIARLEMWVDGELAETQTPDPAAGGDSLNLDALFELTLNEGTHMFYWRTVDNSGLVGQSQLVSVEVLPRLPVAEDQDTIAAEPPPAGAPDEQPTLPSGEPAPAPPESGKKPPSPPGEPAPAPPESGKKPKPKDDKPTPPELPDVIFPEEIPVIPPGLPALEVATIPIFDIGSFISAVLSNMPKAPSNLQAEFEDCMVRLAWIDNADNETHYNIWMQRLGGPPQLIKTVGGSPSTGPAWTEFRAPAFGIYGFWVEAVNGLGSQPSQMKGLAINDASCSQEVLATKLVIEALDMHVSGGFDKVYCYLSLEGAAAQRIPGGTEYISVHNQWGDITKYWGGDKRILLPIPADEEVLLEGECLGVGAGDPVSLGKFQERAPKAQWDGQRLEVQGKDFSVGYRIYYLGSQQAHGVYFYTDYSIPKPKIIDVIKDAPSDPNDVVEDAILARRPNIAWKWDGDESQITSFTIFLDGKLFQWAEPDWRKTRLTLPEGCGQTYQLTMTANAGEAQSVPSSPFTYTTPPCPLMAEVQFLTISVEQTDDATFNPFDVAGTVQYSPCDQMQVRYRIWVEGATRIETGYGSNQFTLPFKCKTEYGFKQSLGADPDTITVPLDPVNPQLVFGAKFVEEDNWPNPDDTFVEFDNHFPVSLDQWPGFEKTIILKPPSKDTDTAIGITMTFRVKGYEFSE